MFLEGARWDSINHKLSDCRPKELFSDLPMIWLHPIPNRKAPITGIYNCPIYKVNSFFFYF